MAERALGSEHGTTLRLQETLARALFADKSASLGNLREAVELLQDTLPKARRVFGPQNPITVNASKSLDGARKVLAAGGWPQKFNSRTS